MKIIIAILTILVLSGTAYGLQCSNRPIKEGDSIYRVLTYCGKPAHEEVIYVGSYGKIIKTLFYDFDAQYTTIILIKGGEVEKIEKEWK